MTQPTKPPTKAERLFDGLAEQWITPDDAYRLYGIRNCLSQRCGDFLRDGRNIVSKWIKDKSGRNVCKAYRRLPGKGC